ncbi:MAG TPA: hypothetical protein VF782_00220 [Allosphingosinicella sp.]
MDWQEVKETIAVWTELDRDALHIYAALLVQVGAALLVRRRVSHWLPWIAVLAFAVGNEWLDTYADGLAEQWELDAGLHDLWNTMLLPTLLLLFVRFAPRVFTPPPAQEPVTQAVSPDS